MRGPFGLIATTTRHASNTSSTPRALPAGAAPRQPSRRAAASAATTSTTNPSPMMKPEWRLLQTSITGTSSQMARPPWRRCRSTRNRVRQVSAKVIICARGPQIG